MPFRSTVKQPFAINGNRFDIVTCGTGHRPFPSFMNWDGLLSESPFESILSHKKEPQRAPVVTYQRFLASEGLSHGLKKCPPDTLLPCLRQGRPFESILSHKKGAPKGSFLVREMGLEPTRRNHTHLKRACLPFQHSRSCLNIITAEGDFVNPFCEKGWIEWEALRGGFCASRF